MLRVLVTGSSGFIGKYISNHLQRLGFDVIGLHKKSKKIKNNCTYKEVLSDLGSTNDVNRVFEDIAPCDIIIHSAASLNMNLYNTEMSYTNCLGTQNILWLASQWNVKRFIFFSSLPLIGKPLILPITELHPPNPQTAYHAAKLFGEQIVTLAELKGINTISLRITSPVGPGMPTNRLLSFFIQRALKGLPLEITGLGTRKQNYIDIRDIANVIELCLKKSEVGIYNIASKISLSNIDLANKCIERCDSKSIIKFNGLTDVQDDFDWNVSIEKARIKLGFCPIYNIIDTIDAVKDELINN